MEEFMQSLAEQGVSEGQLPVDILETPTELIIIAPVAGVEPTDVNVSVNGDVLTIRGERKMEVVVDEENFVSRECHWGTFSRSIILPVDVKAEEAAATFHHGMLRVTFPKAVSRPHIPIVVIDEE